MGLLTITPVARVLNNTINPYTTVRNINTARIFDVRAANAAEIAVAPTAVSTIIISSLEYNQPFLLSYVSAASVASVLAAIAVAQSGALGGGASGQTALVAGTKAITIPGLTTSSLAFVQLVTPNTASSTIQYKAVCTANTLTITALVAAGTINVADISTLNYAILG